MPFRRALLRRGCPTLRPEVRPCELRSTWWPWLKTKYGLNDTLARPCTGSMQPYFADKAVAQQGFPTSELFVADKASMKVNFFMFADDG